MPEKNKYLFSDDQKEFQPNVKLKKKKKHLQINCHYKEAVSELLLKGKNDTADISKLNIFLLPENVFYLFSGPLKPDLRSALI